MDVGRRPRGQAKSVFVSAGEPRFQTHTRVGEAREFSRDGTVLSAQIDWNTVNTVERFALVSLVLETAPHFAAGAQS